MALSPKRLAQAMPTSTAEATIYTVPGGQLTIVKQIVIANVAAAAVDVTVSLVPSGGAAGAANRIVPTVAVPAKAVLIFDLTQVMNTGDFLVAQVSAANGATITVSGAEMTVAALAAAGLQVALNNGMVGTRPKVNFLEGSNIDLIVTDDGANGEVDVLIAAVGVATSTDIANAVAAHALVGDPHGVYQLEAEKNAANGYAGLDAGSLVPVARMATGTPDGTKFLRDDRTWAAAGGSLARLGWHMTRAATQSIPLDAMTAISWDTEVQDTPANFTPHATTGTTFTVPTGGGGLWFVNFLINAGAAMQTMAYAKMQVVAGGVTYVDTDFDDVNNPVVGAWNLALGPLPLAAADTIVCSFMHSATAALNVTGRLQAYRLGA